MILPAPYERSVFINCPLGPDYEPILQAILFCVVHLGFTPRLAVERSDGGEDRITKILSLLEASRFSIHDLSRTRARKSDEVFRLNMPFELALDYACRRYRENRREKMFLVFEQARFEAKAALSDLSGCDFEVHGGEPERAMGGVRDFLVNEAGARSDGRALIRARYEDFQGWYWDKQLAAGSSEEDIRAYPTREVLRAMFEWVELGEPI